MEEFEEERVGLHKSINLHSKRLITAYYAILEACQIDITRDSILRTQVDNFQVKLNNDSFLHSSRSLYTIASDLSLNWLLHTPKLAGSNLKVEEFAKAEHLYRMRENIKHIDRLLDK